MRNVSTNEKGENLTINCLIPARLGSKRIPQKNIKLLGNKPLIAWSIQTALECNLIPIVSSESQEILDVARQYHAEILKRPMSLSRDIVGDYPIIKHFWEYYPADITIYLRPTTPFRKKEYIFKALKAIKADKLTTSLRSVELMSESAFKAFIRGNRGILSAFHGSFRDANRPDQSNRQTYKGNGYVDIIKGCQAFTGDLWGKRCFGFKTPAVIELDTKEDWIKAEQYLCYQQAEKDGLSTEVIDSSIISTQPSIHNQRYQTLYNNEQEEGSGGSEQNGPEDRG